MTGELLILTGLFLLVWGYIARLALGAIDGLVPSFGRMRRKVGQWLRKVLVAPREKRGVVFWLLVFLPFVLGFVLFVVVLVTGEGGWFSCLSLGLWRFVFGSGVRTSGQGAGALPCLDGDAGVVRGESMVALDTMVNTVMHGDCIEVLAGLPEASVDMVLTDPPYVARYRASDGRTIAGDQSVDWILPAFGQVYRVLRDDSFCVTTYGWNRVDVFMRAWRMVGFRPIGHFVWVKSYSSVSRFTNGCHEMAYLLAKGEPEKPSVPLDDVLGWRYSGNMLHPTQKAVRSLMPFIRVFSEPGDIVLDPFAGAASTAVAALALGRRFIAIELREDYYQIACARVKRWKGVFGVG